MESCKILSRRAFLRWCALSAGASSLAGCALFRREAPAPAATLTPDAVASKPKLLYARPAGQEFGLLSRLISEFNQSGLAPGIEVQEVELSGDPYRLLIEMAASGIPADVHPMLDEAIPEWVRLGRLLSLDPFLATDETFDIGDFYEQYLVNVRFKGQLWALPWTCVGWYLFINKDLFEAAGVSLPPADWSWDDFRGAALKLTDEEHNRWACGPLQGWPQLCERVWQNGAEAFNPGRTRCLLDAPEAIEAIEFWVDLVLIDKVVPGAADARPGGYALFRDGKVAMYEDMLALVQSWKEARFRWEIAYQPYRRRKVNLLLSGSQAISAQTRYRLEAWTLLKYMTSTEALVAWSTAMRLPTARKSANAARPYIDPAIDIDWDLVQVGIDNGRLLDVTPRPLEVGQLLESLVKEVFSGQGTVKEVVAQYVPQINVLIGGGFEG
jgi:multiple sugar transport system substrate-binding protein